MSKQTIEWYLEDLIGAQRDLILLDKSLEYLIKMKVHMEVGQYVASLKTLPLLFNQATLLSNFYLEMLSSYCLSCCA